MKKEQIQRGISTLNDAATAGMLVDAIIENNDEEAMQQLFHKLMDLFEGGHPQTRELAIIGKRALNA